MRAWLGALLCAACAAARPPAPPAAGPTPAPRTARDDAPARPTPARPQDRATGIAGVWQRALAGDVSAAQRALDRLLRAEAEKRASAEQPARPPLIEQGLGPANPVSAGEHLAIRVNGGLVVTSAAGALERFVEDDGFTDPLAVAGTPLVAVGANDALRLIDLASGLVVRERHIGGTSFAAGPDRVAYPDGDAEHPKVVIERASNGEVIGRVSLPEGSYVSGLGLIADGNLLVIRGDQNRLYDVSRGRELASYEGVFAPQPIVDGTGRLALVASDSYDAKGPQGETRLIDVASGRVIARSKACSFPTLLALSPDESVLVVGDLRAACLLKMPSLSKLGVTEEVRPGYGFDDDLQNLTGAWFFDGQRTLALETADGALGLYRLGQTKALYKGRGSPIPLANGQLAVVDRGGGTLVVLDGFRVRQNRALSADEVMGAPISELRDTHSEPEHALFALDRELCRVDGWVVPQPVCAHSTR